MRTACHYPTDVSDAQWEIRQRVLPKPTRCSPVDSLRVRWVPLVRSFRRLAVYLHIAEVDGGEALAVPEEWRETDSACTTQPAPIPAQR